MADVATRLAIIGCGNPNRRDDGVGPAVIALLRSHTLPLHAELFDAGTDGMAVIYRARGSTHLIIVDARAPGGAAGAIYDVPGDVLELAPPTSFGLHDFRWDHALYAGRRTYGTAFPQHIRVFLIEAQSIELALGLNDVVSRAAQHVCGSILALAASASADGWG